MFQLILPASLLRLLLLSLCFCFSCLSVSVLLLTVLYLSGKAQTLNTEGPTPRSTPLVERIGWQACDILDVCQKPWRAAASEVAYTVRDGSVI